MHCTALHTSGNDVQDKADCIVGVYCDTKPVVLWVHNASYIVGVSGNHNSDTRVGLRNIAAPFLHCSRILLDYSLTATTILIIFLLYA